VEYPQIALKTNYYAANYPRKDEIQQLEARYSIMTIENFTTGTPFREPQDKEQEGFEGESSKKEERPDDTLESMYQPKRVKLTPTWSAPMRGGTITTEGIKFIKKVHSETMNIESVCEELIRRDSIGSNVKRNLVF
jgi:hypothetical protein